LRDRSLETLLEVDALRVAYKTASGPLRVLGGLSFSIHPGEVVGLLGESGSGKTTTAQALIGALPAEAQVEGAIDFRGADMAHAGERALRQIRGAQISYIPQEPLLNLNPVLRVIDQVAEVVRAHARISAKEGRKRAQTALQQVGLEDPAHFRYPHQLSGGQRQRVLIAQAIVCHPALVVADEPTASLDEAAEREILTLLGSLVARLGISLFLISHDPGVLEAVAHRIHVIYAGRIVESGDTREVLDAPAHPYTRALLGCRLDKPGNRAPSADRHVPAIEGAAPSFDALPPGCPFEPRCREKLSRCGESEPPELVWGARRACCFLYEQA
jgi:peptide/nickel transport system ATP-binding protein